MIAFFCLSFRLMCMETLAMEPWRIELFGGFRVRRLNVEITRFATQKTDLLLAYLASFIDRKHSRDELVELLWPDADVDAGRHNLRQTLCYLRKPLEDDGQSCSVIEAGRHHIGLDPRSI